MSGPAEEHDAALYLLDQEGRRLVQLDSNHELLRFVGIENGKLAEPTPEQKDVLDKEYLDRFAPKDAQGNILKSGMAGTTTIVNYYLAIKAAADSIKVEAEVS